LAGIKVTQIKLFTCNNKTNKNIYYPVNEFVDVHEIKENFNEITENLGKVEFRINIRNFHKRIICLNLQADKEITIIKAEKIFMPNIAKVLNTQQEILTIKPNKITIKLLLKLEVRIKNI
jgi:hypothetical protein